MAVKKRKVSKRRVRSVKKKTRVRRRAKPTRGKIEIKKEFDEFAKKVARLESLKRELNALSAEGFETDVKLIRAKLKDVSAIPEIVKSIASLKRKIALRAGKKVKARRQAKMLRAEQGKLKQKVGRIEGIVLKRRARKQLSRDEVEDVKDIPKLERQLKLLKHEIGSHVKSVYMKRRIRELERLIARGRARKQLSRDEVEDVKDIPKLEKELKVLKKGFAEHTKATKAKIDAGVGVLVDTKFGDFVAQLKSELTERLKGRELMMDSQLKSDLESREKLFARRYRDLAKEFHRKYADKIHREFKMEIKKRFDAELDKKIEGERKKMHDSLVRENARNLASEKKAMLNRLHDEYEAKKIRIEQKLKKNTRSLNESKRIMLRSLKKHKASNDAELARGIEALKRHNVLNDAEFARKVERMKEKMRSEVGTRVGKLMKQKEAKLRDELREEYNARLAAEVRAKKIELDKRKNELEKHVIAQAQKMFK